MRPTLRLGTIKGIRIGVHWSLVVIGALLVTSLAGGLLPAIEPDAGGSYWAAAILATGLFFASILAHELAHSFVAIRRGQRVEDITLWMFGGVARLRDEARDARSELLVAIAGPLTSLGLGVGFVGLAFALDAGLPDGSLLPSITFYLGIVNGVLGVFNLLPGSPLDGGRVLTALLWGWHKDRRRAQVTAARAGRVLGMGLIALGVYGFLTDSPFGDVWTALIGWFVLDASRAEEMQARLGRVLDTRQIASLMAPVDPPLPTWTPLADALHGPEVHTPASPYVLLADFAGTPVALLDRRGAQLLSGAAHHARAGDAALALGRLPRAPATMPAREAFGLGLPIVVVDAEGQIVGAVGTAEVERALQRRPPQPVP
jgi:Zn-dependent protease